jgi:ribosome-binding factor A
MSSRRIDRINGLLREEISQLLAREIKDPRLSGIISITQVKTSGDLRNAVVYVSVMGDDTAKQEALAGIQSAATFLRRELRERLSLRYVPFMKFQLDESIEDAEHVLRIMDRIKDDRAGGTPLDDVSSYRGPLTFPLRNG